MDIIYFIKILWQRKWMIALATLIAGATTYILVDLLPPTYKSEAVLATGITIRKNIKLSNEDPFVQKYEIVSAFSNLTATMKSRTSLRLLTYRLLIHDLAPDSTVKKPFRTIAEDAAVDIDAQDRQALIDFLAAQKDSLITLQLSQAQNMVFNQVAKAMEYDFENLTKALLIERLGETDYLRIEFSSESPGLCEFAVNAFCEEFLEYNNQQVNLDESEAVNFYFDLARNKRGQLDQIDRQLNTLKEENRIVNLNEQTKTVVNQVNDLEIEREQQQKSIPGLAKSIDLLDNYLVEYAQKNADQETQVKMINEGLVETIEQIKTMRLDKIQEDQQSEFTAKGSSPAPDLKTREIAQQALIDQYIEELKRSKIDLDATLIDILNKRIETEVALAIAQESVKSLDRRIDQLKLSSTDLISVEAQIKMLESQREMALQEYLQSFTKLNDARVIAQSSLYPLSIFEYAQFPEEPEPSKKALSAAFAGIAAAGMLVFALFILLLFDNTLKNAHQFEKITDTPLLTTLFKLPKKTLSVDHIFEKQQHDRYYSPFKESLRKVRQQMEHTGAQRFLLTSTQDQTDRTFMLITLAYSLAQKNYRVLLVDTNLKNNQLSTFAGDDTPDNPLVEVNGPLTTPQVKNLLPWDHPLIDVIPCQATAKSPSEVLANKNFDAFLTRQALKYDFLLLEAPGLNEYADAQEIMDYVEKVIVVMDARHSFKRNDQESINYLKGLNSKFMGAILTQVDVRNEI